MAIMAMTTSNSISVNPEERRHLDGMTVSPIALETQELTNRISGTSCRENGVSDAEAEQKSRFCRGIQVPLR